ncbi:hypothetical protein KP509_31G043700 [Ceratopteris richardii]|uniref:Uncharacterized protein n=1 Tax=Ceratopteris richardii TaxID=49495 RepID=A0A8T2QXI7_CERRI|nr:hypothetical protein KP509_31G043700 [Ceratopteris richardii]
MGVKSALQLLCQQNLKSVLLLDLSILQKVQFDMTRSFDVPNSSMPSNHYPSIDGVEYLMLLVLHQQCRSTTLICTVAY